MTRDPVPAPVPVPASVPEPGAGDVAATPAVTTTPPAAECRELVQIYESAGGPVHALRGVSAVVERGSLAAVVGPSGAGKSTFLRLLACLERPTVGEVVIDGAPTARLSGRARRRLVARRIGYVFQSPADNLVDDLTVAEHVRVAWRMRAPEPPGAVDELLALTDLAGVARRRPGGLSVGQQQRVAFAMAMAASPALIVADEPTANLDPAGADALVELLPRLVGQGQTLVVCTHDARVTTAADKVLVISDGTLAAESTRGGDLLAVVDEADRIHLPRDLVDRFPDRRVRLTVEPDGTGARIERPMTDPPTPTSQAPPSTPPSTRASAPAPTGVVVRASGASRWGLPGVDLAVAPGELVVVTGPSLSGKTTLVELLAGWAAPDTGTVHWDAWDAAVGDGRAGPPPWSYVAVVPQAFAVLEELTVLENIQLARRVRGRHDGPGGRRDDRDDELLQRLGLDRLRHRGAFEVSVGERQRTMVARALADRPRLLVADEPVAHQDERHAGVVLDLLAEAAADGTGVVVATRDPDLVASPTRTVTLPGAGVPESRAVS